VRRDGNDLRIDSPRCYSEIARQQANSNCEADAQQNNNDDEENDKAAKATNVRHDWNCALYK